MLSSDLIIGKSVFQVMVLKVLAFFLTPGIGLSTQNAFNCQQESVWVLKVMVSQVFSITWFK